MARAIRFTASEWNELAGRKISVMLFALAMVHLRQTEEAPLTTASGRTPFVCWGCETAIERGEPYRAVSSDRRERLGCHESCLRQIRAWAAKQENLNR